MAVFAFLFSLILFRIFVAVLLAMMVIYVFAIFPARRHHPDLDYLDGRFIAHRGLHDLEEQTPENSIPAFRAAIAQNLPIETDIHLTKDGRVVVFHDDTLTRVCGIDGKISDMTYAELKDIPLAGTEEHMPTLEEVLTLVNGQVPLLIEFKAFNLDTTTRLCEAADAILEHYRGPYLIQSFFPFVLHWYRKHRPDICRGQLALKYDSRSRITYLLGKLIFNCIGRPDFISYDHDHANRLGVRLNRLFGAEMFGWTYRSQADLDNDTFPFDAWIFETFMPEELELTDESDESETTPLPH